MEVDAYISIDIRTFQDKLFILDGNTFGTYDSPQVITLMPDEQILTERVVWKPYF